MGEFKPDRVWTVDVRRTQDGYVEIREGDLDLPVGLTFDEVKGVVERVAEDMARRGDRVDWVDTVPEVCDTRWN